MKKPNYYKDIAKLLLELKKLYPNYTVAMHISTALDGYHDIWGVTDKELLFALNKYKVQLELDVPHQTEGEELEQIIQDGMNLSSILDDEEEDY